MMMPEETHEVDEDNSCAESALRERLRSRGLGDNHPSDGGRAGVVGVEEDVSMRGQLRLTCRTHLD